MMYFIFWLFTISSLYQGHAVSQLCKTVEDVVVYGTASVHKHEAIKEHVTNVFDRTVDYMQEVRK